MLRKLWDILSIVAITNVITVLVLVLVMFAFGTLSGSKVRLVRDVLMDRSLAAGEAPTTQPEGIDQALVTAGQRIADDRVNNQRKQLQIDQQMRELKDFQVQLDQARAALDARIRKFQLEKQQWQASRQAERDLLAAEGFKKTMALYESMPPDQVKDLFMAMEEAEVVRYLANMEERKASKIAREFNNSVEKAKLRRIMDEMRSPTPADAPEAAKATAAKSNGTNS